MKRWFWLFRVFLGLEVQGLSLIQKPCALKAIAFAFGLEAESMLGFANAQVKVEPKPRP